MVFTRFLTSHIGKLGALVHMYFGNYLRVRLLKQVLIRYAIYSEYLHKPK